MSEINIDALRATTRRIQGERAVEVIAWLPEFLRAAAQNAESWAVVMPFFVVPGLGNHSFEDKKGDLTGVPKLVHAHLADHGLNPGFVRQEKTGTLADGSSIEGILYRLVARWDTAPADNPLRQIYEAAVEARSKEITDRVPQLIADASAEGNWWTIVHTFFSTSDLMDLGFDGNPENLKGIPLKVYDYLSKHTLQPFLFAKEGRGTIGGCPWDGRYYYIACQWYDVAAPAEFTSL